MHRVRMVEGRVKLVVVVVQVVREAVMEQHMAVATEPGGSRALTEV